VLWARDRPPRWLQLLQAQLQLGNLRIELFGGTAELQALQPRQLQLQLLDQYISGS
jgi:hypothetical protein